MFKARFMLLKGTIPARFISEVDAHRREDNLRSFTQVVPGSMLIGGVLFLQNLVAPVHYAQGLSRYLYGGAYLLLVLLSVSFLPWVLLARRFRPASMKRVIGAFYFAIMQWAVAVAFLDIRNDKGWDALVLGVMVYAILYRAAPRTFLIVLGWLAVSGTAVFMFYFRTMPGFPRFSHYYLYCFAGILSALILESGRMETSLLRAELRNSAEELRNLSIHDALTGMFNRRYLNDFLGQQIPMAKRQGKSISFLLLDLDHFKQVNDRFGHPVGDRILKEAADCVRSSVREYDLLCRYGGEEFLVVLTATDPAEAAIVAERVRANMETADFGLSGQHVTVSIGIASLPQDGTKEEALVAADSRLYKAKREGRNRCVGA